MLQVEDLYDGIPNEKMEAYRAEAMAKWGKETVLSAEATLRGFGKEEMKALQRELTRINERLAGLMHTDPKSAPVQECIARRFAIILKLSGGKIDMGKLEYFRKLGELYVQDNRYTPLNGMPSMELALFMKEAMDHYIEQQPS